MKSWQKKFAIRALQKGVGSMDCIDMLLIQEDPEGEDDTDPFALSASPSEVSRPAPPNPAQPTLTPVSIPASD